MAWIKRNLYFVIGSVVALALMGLAGWFLYSKYALNNDIMANLDQDYAELAKYAQQKPHPGSRDVDNIKLAKEQQQQLRAFIQKARQYFQRIAPIPDEPKPSDQSFSASLSRTIDQLQHQATNASVALPASYSFSFEAQKNKVSFASGSLGPLAVQLGEVKTLCEVLFQAKVNSLDFVRRERVSPDDASGPQTDYLAEKSTTNDLAVMTPYELRFRCFSAELASVLSGFAGSPLGLVVKTINVEPGPATEIAQPVAAMPTPTPYQPPVVAVANPNAAAAEAAYAQRYGLGGGDRGRGRDRYSQPQQPPPYVPPPQPMPVQPGTPAPTKGGALPTVLDEKPLQITLTVVVVKLLPAK